LLQRAEENGYGRIRHVDVMRRDADPSTCGKIRRSAERRARRAPGAFVPSRRRAARRAAGRAGAPLVVLAADGSSEEACCSGPGRAADALGACARAVRRGRRHRARAGLAWMDDVESLAPPRPAEDAVMKRCAPGARRTPSTAGACSWQARALARCWPSTPRRRAPGPRGVLLQTALDDAAASPSRAGVRVGVWIDLTARAVDGARGPHRSRKPLAAARELASPADNLCASPPRPTPAAVRRRAPPRAARPGPRAPPVS
jgi:hypothetical protein